MKETDIAWLAGILEGEGCFDMYETHQGYKAPRVRVEMVDEDIINRIAGLFREIGPWKGTVRRAEPKRSQHNVTYRVQAAGRPLLRKLLPLIRPYMSARRGTVIDAMLVELTP